MVAQPAGASVSPFRQSPASHLHIRGDSCPLCDQEIPPDRLEEISGKIAARERDQTQAITVRLEQQFAADKAQAAAKAKADLELERQQSAEREAAARQEAQQAAEAAAAERLTAAEEARLQAQAKVTEAEAARVAAQQREASFQAQLAELQKSKDAEVAQAKQDAATAAEAASRDRMAEKDQAIVAAQAQHAEVQAKLSALTEQQDETLKQRLDEQREVLEKDKEVAINSERAQAFEVNQKLQSKLNDVQRELEKKSAEELGEGAELNLYDELKKQFHDDRIERIGRGKAGADILHTVMLNGKPCGTIIYDSKNHKQFRSEHVVKLKTDQRAANADYAVLSLHKFPDKTSQLHNRDGVLLANPARVIAAVMLIRQLILQTHTLRLSNAQREEKTARLYAFITSERCAQFFSSVDMYTDGLLQHLVKEKNWHDATMKRRGETYRAIQKTMADLLSEVSLIIGTAAATETVLEESEL